MCAKTRNSGFYGTFQDQLLFELQPLWVDVAKGCTSIRLMDTVGGMVNRDDSVRVHRDEAAGFDLQIHAHVLECMGKI